VKIANSVESFIVVAVVQKTCDPVEIRRNGHCVVIDAGEHQENQEKTYHP
jgi:hypothetical protein